MIKKKLRKNKTAHFFDHLFNTDFSPLLSYHTLSQIEKLKSIYNTNIYSCIFLHHLKVFLIIYTTSFSLRFDWLPLIPLIAWWYRSKTGNQSTKCWLLIGQFHLQCLNQPIRCFEMWTGHEKSIFLHFPAVLICKWRGTSRFQRYTDEDNQFLEVVRGFNYNHFVDMLNKSLLL